MADDPIPEDQKQLSEVQTLGSRSQLEEQKLRLEIEDLARWKLRFLGGLATAVISVLIAVIGWSIQKQHELDEDRFKTIAHRDEVFARVLGDFGNSSPNQRMGAAVALAQFGRPGSDTAFETVAVLANRLSVEEDPAVLSQIVSVLSQIGRPSLPQVADANRRAGFLFGAATGRYVGLMVARRFPKANEENWLGTAHLMSGQHGELDQPVQTFKNDALDTLCSYLEYWVLTPQQSNPARFSEYTLDPVMFLNVSKIVQLRSIEAEYLRLGAGVLHAFQSKQRKALDLQLQEALQEVEKSGRFLAWTSASLVQLLRTNSGTLRGENLDGVVLLGADLRGLELSGMSFRSVYLVGNASKADLSYSDFTSAILASSLLDGTNLTAATLTNATVYPDTLVFGAPELTGANWWDVLVTNIRGSSFSKVQMETALEGKFPRNQNATKRLELLANQKKHPT